MEDLLKALLAAYHSKLLAQIDLELTTKAGDPLAEEMAIRLCDVWDERVADLEYRWRRAMGEEADTDRIARQRGQLSNRTGGLEESGGHVARGEKAAAVIPPPAFTERVYWEVDDRDLESLIRQQFNRPDFQIVEEWPNDSQHTFDVALKDYDDNEREDVARFIAGTSNGAGDLWGVLLELAERKVIP
jgi:hypothetical protein